MGLMKYIRAKFPIIIQPTKTLITEWVWNNNTTPISGTFFDPGLPYSLEVTKNGEGWILTSWECVHLTR